MATVVVLNVSSRDEDQYVIGLATSSVAQNE